MSRTFVDDLPGLLHLASDRMVDLRHDLHAHPELSFEEHRTTEVITTRLDELGWTVAPCPTATGAVAVLRGAMPGRRIMLRADIDALPVNEERDLPFRSVIDGVMHACGHDVHTAALLGVADVLARYRESLAGEYTLVFQPAEEGLGGARAMVEGGLFERHPVDAIVGVHVTSLAPLGLVGTRAGIFMSEVTALTVEIHGRGGHGAMASSVGNVVLAASALAPRVGEIVAGLTYEGTDCACSIGVLHAGTASNVVPRRAVLRGTLRTFTPEQQNAALRRLDELLAEIEAIYVVTCVLTLSESAPAVRNDEGVTARATAAAAFAPRVSSVIAVPPLTPSDDVSEFLELVPGCYLMVGGALADGTSGMHHSGEFAIDDAACALVAGVLASAAVDLAQG